ncbi:hypothetical protein HOR55_gp35 [Ralstonia phage RS-PII-1]|uniref:Uncharacterized protein n=1 Tax=Ralstonia phage RS-PII-1 TaxID=1932892 RepID=A0A1L7DQN7_9CAUD|nr:hypothetical protein HOR55_gp35 [Ralstonia phage RS-PII-1]APU00322.1 hypothetical protein [Ralstonia phage RS-PII-1]
MKRTAKDVQLVLTSEEADLLALITESYQYLPIHRLCGAPSVRFAIELTETLKDSKQ